MKRKFLNKDFLFQSRTAEIQKAKDKSEFYFGVKILIVFQPQA